jgi:polyhydroxyalkanoate synthesis repressor PhaR
MRTIKRYPNRKLYDLERKRYVTLDDISVMIQDGEDIQVIDHETGDDLTSVTLSQIIFEREKKQSGFLPKSILTALIRTSTAPIDYLKKSVSTSVSALQLLENEIDHRIDALVSKGELAKDEADRLRKELYGGATETAKGLVPDIKLDAALSKLNVPTYEDIQTLESQVEKLMASVDRLLAVSESMEETNGEPEPATDSEPVPESELETADISDSGDA